MARAHRKGAIETSILRIAPSNLATIRKMARAIAKVRLKQDAVCCERHYSFTDPNYLSVFLRRGIGFIGIGNAEFQKIPKRCQPSA